MKKERRKFSEAFKVALEAIHGVLTVSELSKVRVSSRAA
jgi:hypothetical protein